MTDALEVVVTARVVSFRDPLYSGVQVGLPCPPPATVGGMLAAAGGGWPRVDPGLRFAMAFRAGGRGVDLETYHPLGKGDPTPKDRDFLADATLTVWLLGDVDRWRVRLRRPAWPLRLGRSQDLVGLRVRPVRLRPGPGRQGHALLPADATRAGTILQLPTMVSEDRSRTLWDSYRYAAAGSEETVTTADGLATPDGQAVVPLPPVHPAYYREPVAP